ncbi:MAG: TRAP transporter small permease [Spirochaetales bacterium]|nr:TRAP transporter small permease [Spirochaetales bacterium]
MAEEKNKKIKKIFFTFLVSVCSIAIVAMVFLMLVVVFGRYFFKKIPNWSEEFCLFMMSWLAFFGAALIERDKAHIRVSVVDLYYPVPLLRVFSVIRYVIKLIFLCGMTYWGFVIVFTAKDKFASVNISRGWFFLPGAVSGLMMTLILISKMKEELVDVWHNDFGREVKND